MKEYLLDVIENVQCAKDTWQLTLRCTRQLAEEVQPGQFAHIAVPRADLLLRRPLDIFDANVPERTLSFIYAVKGGGTQSLAQCSEGDTLSVIAPLGKPFPDVTGKKIFLLGGGLGVTPLYALARQSAYSVAFFGWRDKECIFCMDEFLQAFSEFNLYTDDGSMGQQGFAIEGLKARAKLDKPDMIFACGPMPLFKALKAAEIDAETYVCMEQRMGCGIGACLTCSCKIDSGKGVQYKRVCADGPVFNLKEVVFDA